MKFALGILIWFLIITKFSTPAFCELIDLKYLDSLSRDNIRKDYLKLASDEFLGRGIGQQGEIIAANYIASELRQSGVEPLNSNGDYFQYIPLHQSEVLIESELKIRISDSVYSFDLFNDYIVSKTGEQTFIPTPVQLVFVGYGIVAHEYDYNDYYNIDVRGKIAVILEGEPISSRAEYFNADLPTAYSHPLSKQRIALSRGAIGSIILPSSYVYQRTSWQTIRQVYEFPNIDLPLGFSDILNIFLHPSKVNLLFEGSKHSFIEVLQMHLDGKISSFEMNASLTFRGKTKTRDFLGRNVIGMIEGADPVLKDTYIIVSSHYDAFGIGPPMNGDSIYNGALDNAIGVAATLEIARVVQSMPERPKRTIIFLFTTAEEFGLLGSIYYTLNPIVPLYKTIANINIDGIAFIDEFNSLIGVGSIYSDLSDFLNLTATQLDLKVDKLPPEFREDESFNRSDQLSFARAGIPSMIVIEGSDYKNITTESGSAVLLDYFLNTYHTPFDDAQQAINYKAVIQHTGFLMSLIFNVGNSKTVPLWNKDSEYLSIFFQNRAEKK